MMFDEAVNSGIIDPEKSTILLPSTEESILMADAIGKHILQLPGIYKLYKSVALKGRMGWLGG